jgi:hydrogenase expression/formation protein HypE
MSPFDPSCPLPISGYEQIVLGHGSGGRLSDELVRSVFLPAFANPALARLEDQATLELPGGERIALSTDSYVVRPIFFPGGDIGKLAVHGTVNDLVVGGARPLYLTAAFVLEEGLPLSELRQVVASMSTACAESRVALVTGDTKVVDRGKGDKVFITTTGVGIVPKGRSLSIHAARPGDSVLVSGTMGDHGVAILSVREGLEFETPLESDTAALGELVQQLLEACPSVRAMRDPTRGGLASTLNEIATAAGVGIAVDEQAVPVRDEVQAACEMLGLDPLYVANEGKLVAILPESDEARAIVALRSHPLGRRASVVGRVAEEPIGKVTVRSRAGGIRLLPMLAGEQLPRIC